MKNDVHLEHALLDVRDLSESLRFYAVLFPEWIVRWSGKTRSGAPWAHFGPPGNGQPGYLSLAETPAATHADTLTGNAVLIEHVGFAHPDVEDLVARMGAAGVAATDRIEDEHYRRAYFKDPDGHELEFVQQLRG